jgi:orotidine-5'-phosphate decarboxylase
MIKDHPLYIEVTKKICSWNQNGNIGAVVGATYSQDLEKILQVISSSNKTIPLLIPGIGTQGGDIKKLMAMLTRQGNIFANRINSSSAILYAHEKNQDVPFYISAINELEILINETNSYIL